ncbi:MAG: DNA-3-methyladenine glycosylase I, partial [Bacteroidota bacterium]
MCISQPLVPKKRCAWVNTNYPDYIQYHDQEWGVPVHEDTKHFELLSLEGAQAGLSWLTILKKRAGYRKAFRDFAIKSVAKFTNDDLEQLYIDSNIVPNRLKIQSVINN